MIGGRVREIGTDQHIIGLLRPDEGRIHVFGRELTTMTTCGIQAVQACIGTLFQGAVPSTP